MNQPKQARLLKLLKRQWITPLECLEQCGLMTLSQRVSEFRRDGLTIIDKWVETSSGSRVKAYRLLKG